MKHFCLTALFITAFFCSYAVSNTVSVNGGRWSQPATWSQGRVPASGDTLMIPANYTLVIDNNLNIVTWTFVIKIYGTLNLNVGKLDIGPASVITIYDGGKITSQKENNGDKILIGGVSKYLGSNGTIYGPAFASAATGAAPQGFIGGAALITLPVKFVSFSLTRKGSDVLVQWATSEEVNAYRYEVERSFDARAWQTVAYLSAAGNSRSLNQYAYTDKNIGSRSAYYRVKQVDGNGNFSFTTVQVIKAETLNGDIKVAAAPNKLVLDFPQEIKNGVSVRLISLNGQVIKEQRIERAHGQVILSTSARGNYFVSVSNGQDISMTRQVVL